MKNQIDYKRINMHEIKKAYTFMQLLKAHTEFTKELAKRMSVVSLYDQNNINHWEEQVILSNKEIAQRFKKLSAGKNYIPVGRN